MKNSFFLFSLFNTLLFLLLVFLFSSLYEVMQHWKKFYSEKELKKFRNRFFYLSIHRYFFQKCERSEERKYILLSLLLNRYFFQICFLLFFFFSFLQISVTESTPQQYFIKLFLFTKENISLVIFFLASFSFLSVLILFTLSEGLSRLLSQKKPHLIFSWFLLPSSCILTITAPLFIPILYLSYAFFARKGKKCHKHAITQATEEVLAIVEETDSHKKLEVAEKKIIESVITFRHRIVREVMLPRIDIFLLSESTPIYEAARALQKERYSRIPVYKDSIDNVSGVLMYKDLLKTYVENSEQNKNFLKRPIRTLLKQVLYTPETKKISHLLQDFRKKQIHLAIVVDEYGGTSGMITIEDILEEIVGEIEDEDDMETDRDALFTQKIQNGWIVDAKMSIIDIQKHCNFSLPQGNDYDTIGGYVFQNLGIIPQPGTKISHENFLLEIINSDDRSIKRIRIISTPKQ